MFLFRPELQEFKSAQEDLATSDMMPFIALCQAITPAQENLNFFWSVSCIDFFIKPAEQSLFRVVGLVGIMIFFEWVIPSLFFFIFVFSI